MKKLLLSLFTVILLLSCKDSKIQQGEIVYEISYPYSNLSGIMEVMLPKKMTVKFKGDRMIASIEKGKIFRTDILSQGKSKKLMMRLDFGSEKIVTDLKTDDLNELVSSQPDYNAIPTGETDTLVGLEVQYYTVDSHNETVGKFECAFSTNLSVEETDWFNSYKGTKGIPLEYIIERYGVIMKLKADKFTSREIADDEFETEIKFKPVSYKKYEKKVN